MAGSSSGDGRRTSAACLTCNASKAHKCATRRGLSPGETRRCMRCTSFENYRSLATRCAAAFPAPVACAATRRASAWPVIHVGISPSKGTARNCRRGPSLSGTSWLSIMSCARISFGSCGGSRQALRTMPSLTTRQFSRQSQATTSLLAHHAWRCSTSNRRMSSRLFAIRRRYSWSAVTCDISRYPRHALGHDEAPTAHTVFITLGEYFGLEIPRQQQHVVGLADQQLIDG